MEAAHASRVRHEERFDPVMRRQRWSNSTRRTVLVAALGVACGLLLAQDAKKSSSANSGLAGAADAKSAQAAGEPDGVLSQLVALEQKARKALPLQQKLTEALRKNDLKEAEKLCEQWAADLPRAPEGHYNLACVQALRGQSEAAFKSLARAIELGFRDAAHVRADPDLVSLRADPRFEKLAKEAETAKPTKPPREPEPAEIKDGVALVADGNTALDAKTGLLRPQFKPTAKPAADAWPTTLSDAAGKLVNQWWKEGTAAGHHGDLYDNRDGDHSDLDRKLFPQLARIEYGPEAQALRLHWGLPQRIFQPGVVLGNASVALTGGPFWRSMPRLAVSDARSAALLYEQYSHNQLYVYPCHADHKPGRNGKEDGKADGKDGGHGDVYFANTPYLVASQGSSGSDQVFLQALALTMAALRPEVKEFLVEQNSLAPTLQMIFRQSNAQVAKPEDYFTGKAHPPVFRGEDIRREQMVRLAHDLTKDRLPPLVSVKVIEEDKPVQGRDYFDPQPTEQLFDTPCAVARVMRGTAQRRRMVVSAEASRHVGESLRDSQSRLGETRPRDGETRPRAALRWRWVVLRGDAEAVRIRPLNDEGSRVELSVPWHARRPVEAGSKLETNRVDIACFAGNGAYWSAPAFVCYYCPDNEERVYDAEGRIQSVTYNANYADPVVVGRKAWRDVYRYADGKLAGWTRIRGARREEFTPDGRRVVARDAAGRPAEIRAVRYVVKSRRADELPVVEQEDVNEEPAKKSGP